MCFHGLAWLGSKQYKRFATVGLLARQDHNVGMDAQSLVRRTIGSFRIKLFAKHNI